MALPRSSISFALIMAGLGGAHAAPEHSHFEDKVRPLLIEHCYECHSAGHKIKGGLSLDHRTGWQTGGDSGPALKPGDPGASLLLRAVSYEDRDLKMPPEKKLSAGEIGILRDWITAGAPDPRDEVPGLLAHPKKAAKVISADGLWSFQPLAVPTPQTRHPMVRNTAWPRDPVDHHLLAALEKTGLTPVNDAAPEVLVRRVFFDLTGLPPSAEETAAFHTGSCTELVDRLLASEAFAERWAQHWLDITRFAESSGGGRTLPFKDAWRYRDYVITSIHQDVPLDQMITEHLAGDLLPADSDAGRARQLTATAFLALGPTNYEEQDKGVLRMDIIDEQLETIGRSFMGMTLGCARCHDHKFDPVTTRDYYAMAGILRSTRTLQDYTSNVGHWIDLPLPMDKTMEEALQQKNRQLASLKEQLQQTTALTKQLELKAEIQKRQSLPPFRPETMGVSEENQPGDCPVHIRGNLRNLGPPVPRGFIKAAMVPGIPPIPDHQSGRLQLAQWMTHPQHPLTARVMVNRIWMHLFGEGLVRSVDNFGAPGETPSHPLLLDHLAHDFIREGWSLKKMVRRLVLTRSWQLASVPPPAASWAAHQASDPDNRLLWRAHRRRLDAHALRDAILTVSGGMDRGFPGPDVKAGPVDPNSTEAQTLEYTYVFSDLRRSLYSPAFRNQRLEFFANFDFADINSPIGQRTRSTIVPQALYFLNHPFIIQQSEAAAGRLLTLTPAAPDHARIDWLWRSILGRLPSGAERQQVLDYLQLPSPGSSPAGSTARWSQIIQTLFATADFRFLD